MLTAPVLGCSLMRALLIAGAVSFAACNCGGSAVGLDAGPGPLGGGTPIAGGGDGGAAVNQRPIALRLELGGGTFARTCGNGTVFAVSDAGVAPTDVELEVRLDGGPALSFFEGPCTGAPLARVRIREGTSSAAFRFRTVAFGAQSVIAEADGLSPGVAMPTATALVRLDTSRSVVPLQTCALVGHLETVAPGTSEPVGANRDVRFTLVTARPFGGASNDGGCTSTQFDVTLPAGQSRVPLFATALSGSTQPGFLQLTANVPQELTLDMARIELFAECLPAGTTCGAGAACCGGGCDAGVCP